MKLMDLAHRIVRNTEWHAHGLSDPVLSITGEMLDKGTFCWRRWNDVRWEYRSMTTEEAEDAATMWAIK